METKNDFKIIPNPLSSNVNVLLTLASPTDVCLAIFNNHGQSVGTLINGYVNAGQYNMIWNKNNKEKGTYYFSLKQGSGFSMEKVELY